MAKQVVIPSPPSELHRRQLTQEKPKKQKKVVTFDPSLMFSDRNIRPAEPPINPNPDPESAELPHDIDESGSSQDAQPKLPHPRRAIPTFRTQKLLDKKHKASVTFTFSDSRQEPDSNQASANQIQTSIIFKNKRAEKEAPSLAPGSGVGEGKWHRLRKESHKSADRLELPSEAFPAAGRHGNTRALQASDPGSGNSPPTTHRILLLTPERLERGLQPDSLLPKDRQK